MCLPTRSRTRSTSSHVSTSSRIPGKIQADRTKMLREPRRTAGTVKRLEVAYVAKREGVGGAVACGDERRCSSRQLLDLSARDARKIGVENRHRPAMHRQGARHRLTLPAGAVDDESLLGEFVHSIGDVGEHGQRQLWVAQTRLTPDPVWNEVRRHGARLTRPCRTPSTTRRSPSSWRVSRHSSISPARASTPRALIGERPRRSARRRRRSPSSLPQGA